MIVVTWKFSVGYQFKPHMIVLLIRISYCRLQALEEQTLILLLGRTRRTKENPASLLRFIHILFCSLIPCISNPSVTIMILIMSLVCKFILVNAPSTDHFPSVYRFVCWQEKFVNHLKRIHSGQFCTTTMVLSSAWS